MVEVLGIGAVIFSYFLMNRNQGEPQGNNEQNLKKRKKKYIRF